jgi:hypothetical protein
METFRMPSRSGSTIRSFLKKWNSQGIFGGQVARLKTDDLADAVIEAIIRDRRSSIRQVGAALALSREQVRLTRHRNRSGYWASRPFTTSGIRFEDVSAAELNDSDLNGQSNSRKVNFFEFFLSGID